MNESKSFGVYIIFKVWLVINSRICRSGGFEFKKMIWVKFKIKEVVLSDIYDLVIFGK